MLKSFNLVRRYATETAIRDLKVTFTLPHLTILNNVVAKQVNLRTSDGEIGILAGHVPTIAQLAPGIVHVMGEQNIKFFVSAGFASVNPDSTLNISAVEACRVEDLDADTAKRQMDETNKKLSQSGLKEDEKAELKAELEVFEAVVKAK